MGTGGPVFDSSMLSGDMGSRSHGLAGLVGNAPTFREAISRLPDIARSDLPVLITGETGTGKELVARAIHEMSDRVSHPFIPINCGRLPDALLEDEFFGYERWAFTGARTPRRGLIAEAENGTLLLDEIDSLTSRGQVALLRVLQDRNVRRVGANTKQRVDVRFVCATNASIAALVDRGQFRPDLYHRLAVFSVSLPPLRERGEDIPLLARHFLIKHGPSAEPACVLTSEAEAALLAHSWPGNVRELEFAVIRGITYSRRRGGPIEPFDLGLSTATPARQLSYKETKRLSVEYWEHGYLVDLMRRHAGNVSAAARGAGMARRVLQRMLGRHGIDPRIFGGQA